MAEASSAPTSGTVTCLRSTTTVRPSITTSVTSAAAAAKTTFSTVAPPPAVRIESSLHRNEVRARADHELTGVRPAECAVAIVGRGPQQAVGGDGAARAGGEAFVEFDGAGLFEQIDHGVAVGAEAEQSASGEQRGRGSDAVAEVTLGGGAEAHPRRRPVHVGDVLGRQVGGVHRRRPRPQRPDIAQHRGRRAAVHREALFDLAGLLRGVDVQRSTVCGSPFHDGGHVFDGDAPDGMQRRADEDGRLTSDLLPQCLDTFGPPVTGAVAEPLLRARPAVRRPARNSDSRCRAG